MSIPIGEVGVSAVSGGAVVLFLMKALPVMMRKLNGNSRNNGSDKPGPAQICRDRGEKMAGYDVTLAHISKGMDDNKAAHKEIIKKLDALK